MSGGFSLIDQFGNPFRGHVDSVGGEVLTEAGRAYVSGALASGGTHAIDINGHAAVAFDMRTAALNGTFVFEGITDNTNWDIIPAFDVGAKAFVTSVVVTTTLTKRYILKAATYQKLRVRISTFVSGSIVAAARASYADYLPIEPFPSIPFTATGASGAGVTLTIAAPAAGTFNLGLFNYITSINLTQFVVAARTAAATPVLATTTNLPNSPVISCDATVGAIGQVINYQFPCPSPLRATLKDTANTFVAPATTSTIWRWNVFGYVAP